MKTDTKKEGQSVACSHPPAVVSAAVSMPYTIDDSTGEVFLQSPDCELSDKFTPKKTESRYLSEVYSALGMDARAARVYGCGDFLEFVVTDESCKLHQANFCRDRLCPMCNWRRSLKIFGQVSAIMDKLQASEDFDFLFLTLTVQNCSASDLPQTVSALFDGWRQMYHENKIFKSVCSGTFRTLEITRNRKTGFYHPHLHTILAVKKSYWHKGYISQKEWTQMWRSSCALDYDPVVFIERIRPKMQASGDVSLAGAVSEVAKYAVKSSDFLSGNLSADAEIVADFVRSISRRRLVAMTGVFRQIARALRLDDPEEGDLIHCDPDSLRADVASVIVRYGWRSGCYTKISE